MADKSTLDPSNMDRSSAYLPHVQGLRGLAVTLVVLFHLFPILPGGFIGVDIFFVISGYLITGSLLATIDRDGRFSVLDFYQRRIRRLMPVAIAAVIAISIAVPLTFPPALWQENFMQAAFSALYVENWYLIWQSQDYMSVGSAASPLQHFWTLSVEGQYYLVWPVVLLFALKLSRGNTRNLRRILAATLTVLAVISFVAIFLVELGPAYFFTFTRAWEIAAGGILACFPSRGTIAGQNSWVQRLYLIVGIALVIGCACAISSTTPFPGVAALVPVGGTLLLISAADAKWGVFNGLTCLPLRYIGDRSYSIYLWHWPLAVMVSRLNDAPWVPFAILLLTLALSHLSFHLIEEPARKSRSKPTMFGLAGTTFAVALASVALLQISVPSMPMVDDPRYPGPASLLGVLAPPGVPPLPPETLLRADQAVVYGNGCHQSLSGSEPLSCRFPADGAKLTVALVGDSHAASWVPALARLSHEQGWTFVSYTKSSCSIGAIGRLESCDVWQQNVVADLIALKPSMVFFAAKSLEDGVDGETPALTVERLQQSWTKLIEQGVRVISIKDVPLLDFDPADCSGSRSCSMTRTIDQRFDPLAAAAKDFAGVELIDLTDAICGDLTCDAIVGNVFVWRDDHHLTATYARMLSPFVANAIGIAQVDTSATAPDVPVRYGLRVICTQTETENATSFPLIFSDEGQGIIAQRGRRDGVVVEWRAEVEEAATTITVSPVDDSGEAAHFKLPASKESLYSGQVQYSDRPCVMVFGRLDAKPSDNR